MERQEAFESDFVEQMSHPAQHSGGDPTQTAIGRDLGSPSQATDRSGLECQAESQDGDCGRPDVSRGLLRMMMLLRKDSPLTRDRPSAGYLVPRSSFW